jgi:signal transduction histidine kinase/tetratricopeptide (TPR) repeat protein
MRKTARNILIKLITCWCLFCNYSISTAQLLNEKDSILNIINSSANDSLRVHLLNKLAFEHLFNDIQKSTEYLDKGFKIAEKSNALYGKSQLLNTKGLYFYLSANQDSALFYLNKAILFSKKYGFLNIEKMGYNNLGMFYWGNGNFDKALSNFYEALEINEKHFPEEQESKANYLNNIGLIYQELSQYDKAIEYHNSTMKIRESLNLPNDIAISFANLGVCFFKKKQYEKSLDYYKSAVSLVEKTNNQRMYYSLHDNIASVYIETGEFEKAIKYLEKSLENKDTNPKSYLSSYTNLSSLHNQLNQTQKAVFYAQKGLELLEKHPNLYSYSAGLHFAFAESNYKLGNNKLAKEHMDIYKTVTDSVFSEKNAKSLAEMEKKYQAAERDLLILKQEQDIQQKKEVIEKQVLWFALSITLLLVLSLILFYLYKKKETDAKRALLEISLAEQKEYSRIQNERLRISRELHDNIGSYLSLISATIENFSSENSSEKYDELQNTVAISLRELRKTVWLLNKQAFNIDELALRLREFFKPLNKNGLNISIENNIDTDLVLSDIQTTHVFRIIQEAVNNAYKHSNCTNIKVELSKNESKEFCFRIEDDGNGFDIDKKFSGNGMMNMKARIEEISGKLEIISGINKGTIVSVCVKIDLDSKETLLT